MPEQFRFRGNHTIYPKEYNDPACFFCRQFDFMEELVFNFFEHEITHIDRMVGDTMVEEIVTGTVGGIRGDEHVRSYRKKPS